MGHEAKHRLASIGEIELAPVTKHPRKTAKDEEN
jgi:hypothetical protein